MLAEQITHVRLATSTGIVHWVLVTHVAAGGVAIASGFVSLFATKGSTVHRRSGLLFVYSMIAMGLVAAGLAAYERNYSNMTGGVLAAYFAYTAMTTLRPESRRRDVDIALMVLALGIGVMHLAGGFQAVASPTGRFHGLPPFPYFMVGTMALLAAVGDARMLRGIAGLRGPSRLARHIWRVCWAMFVATGSFFLGQMKVMPKSMRAVPVLATLAVLPLAALLYWLWRVRIRRTLRGIVLRVVETTPTGAAT